SPVPVTVIDSYNAGMSLGNAVLDVLLRTRVGLSADFLTTIATRQAKAGRTIFTVPNLDTLRKGGRIPALTGLLGQLFQVGSVIILKDTAVLLLHNQAGPAKTFRGKIEIAVFAETPMQMRVQVYGNPDVDRTLAKTL